MLENYIPDPIEVAKKKAFEHALSINEPPIQISFDRNLVEDRTIAYSSATMQRKCEPKSYFEGSLSTRSNTYHQIRS